MNQYYQKNKLKIKKISEGHQMERKKIKKVNKYNGNKVRKSSTLIKTLIGKSQMRDNRLGLREK